VNDNLVQYVASQRKTLLERLSSRSTPEYKAKARILQGGFRRDEILLIAQKRGYKPGWGWRLIYQLRDKGML
jgi:hypothetical protein